MFETVTAETAHQALIEGNERFRTGNSRSKHFLPQDLERLATRQRPFATILGCSDSRVPPELIFDATAGELFVVRVAGNVLSSEVAGSMQYAGAHLRTPLFVVLGHSGCGAIHAALECRFHGAKHRARIQVLVDSILPAFESIDPDLTASELLSCAVEANVRWTMRQILETEAGLRAASGEFTLLGGIYDMRTGIVQFLSDPEV
jgi:carbonic anhydrase